MTHDEPGNANGLAALLGDEPTDSLLRRYQGLKELQGRLSRHPDVDELRGAIAASCDYLEHALRRREDEGYSR